MTTDKISGRTACVAAIRAAGRPLSANEIATKVVSSGLVEGLKGKTPKATLSAQITSGAKKGETFVRVGTDRPARFDVAADVAASPDGLVEKFKTLETTVPHIVDADAGDAATNDDASASDARQAKPHPKPQSKRGRSRATQTA